MVEQYFPRFKSTSECKPGDRVYYYKTNMGWGGGETRRFIASVIQVHSKQVKIALWNERAQCRFFTRVRVDSLSRRIDEFPHLDTSDR